MTDIGVGDGPVRDRGSLAGATLPADRVIDGVDLRAPLTGRGPVPARTLFYYSDSELRAVRKGAYKAHFITSGAYGEGEARREHNPPLLFNLADDPGEHHDIAAMHPDIVADLRHERRRASPDARPGQAAVRSDRFQDPVGSDRLPAWSAS